MSSFSNSPVIKMKGIFHIYREIDAPAPSSCDDFNNTTCSFFNPKKFYIKEADPSIRKTGCSIGGGVGTSDQCRRALFSARRLGGTGVRVCAVVGFPLGAMDGRAKAFEARVAISNGAEEIDAGRRAKRLIEVACPFSRKTTLRA